jgi:hypothetical protein
MGSLCWERRAVGINHIEIHRGTGIGIGADSRRITRCGDGMACPMPVAAASTIPARLRRLVMQRARPALRLKDFLAGCAVVTDPTAIWLGVVPAKARAFAAKHGHSGCA